MTKLEQNPMSSSKGGMQWAPPMNDLTLGHLGYQASYNQNYPGAPPPPTQHQQHHQHQQQQQQQQQQQVRHSLSSSSSSHPPPSSAGTNASSSGSGMKSATERGPDGEVIKPKKRPGASSKKPEVPPGLEHFHSKYPKPTHSYSLLITTAIMESTQNQMTLNEIYEWVMDRYPWYRTAINGWKNSIRHNLSLNKAFMRVPRPPSEPGKGSYWKLDPNHQSPLEAHNGGAGSGGSGGGASRSNRSSRRSSAGQRGSSGKGGSRRATSDPTPHAIPSGGAPEIPLTPVPMLPKRPGQENDPYVFKVDTPPVPSIIPAMPSSSSANRRHSHLLSHDHTYSSPQEQLQHIEQQQQQQGGAYGSHMATQSFGLSALNSQHHHQSALFSPTSPTGSGVSGEYGSPNSFYATSNGAVMDPNSDSASFQRFSGSNLYFSNGNSASGSIPSAGRPLSMPTGSPYGGGNSSHYDYGGQHAGPHGGNNGSNNSGSHPYGHMSQGGAASAQQFYPGSVNYGFPTSNRASASGGPNTQGGYGSQSYRSAHDYSNGSSDYNSSGGGGGHSRPSSMMGLSSPTGSSFVSPTSSSSSNSYPMSQSFGPGPSGMLSPISPGGHSSGPNSALSLPTSSPSSSGNTRQPPNSIVIPQDSKGASNSASGGNAGNSRSHSGW